MARRKRMRGRRLGAVASLVLAAGCVSAFPAIAHATPLTVVTIQFDDGNADVNQWLAPLDNHGFPATFYVNSGTVGTAAKLTWGQLTKPDQAAKEVAAENH